MAIDQKKIDLAKERLKEHKGGKNLVMITSTEKAREMAKKSHESRRNNKERLLSLRSFLDDMGKLGENLSDHAPKGIDVLRMCMTKALHDEEFELAATYADKIAAYETPKLQATTQTNIDLDLKDMTDDEYAEYKKKIQGEA